MMHEAYGGVQTGESSMVSINLGHNLFMTSQIG